MNQLWFYAQREVDTGGYGWDWGGRVDFVYGTDARFTQAADGLEARAFQHELDHLDGRLFVDLLNDAGRMTIKSRLRALEEEFRQQR